LFSVDSFVSLPVCGYQLLLFNLKQLFGIEKSKADSFVLKVIDEENEVVTVSSDAELKIAQSVKSGLVRLELEETNAEKETKESTLNNKFKFRLSLDEAKQYQIQTRQGLVSAKEQKKQLEEKLAHVRHVHGVSTASTLVSNPTWTPSPTSTAITPTSSPISTLSQNISFRLKLAPQSETSTDGTTTTTNGYTDNTNQGKEMLKVLYDLEEQREIIEKRQTDLLCATMREKLLRIRLRAVHAPTTATTDKSKNNKENSNTKNKEKNSNNSIDNPDYRELRRDKSKHDKRSMEGEHTLQTGSQPHDGVRLPLIREEQEDTEQQ